MTDIDELLEVSDKSRSELLKEIVSKALSFECCPYCGNPDLESKHYCSRCEEGKKGFPEADDAYWFAMYLIREYDLPVFSDSVEFKNYKY